MAEYYIGVMSGTSADGIDAILAKIGKDEFSITDFVSISMPSKVRSEILSLIQDDFDALNRAYRLSSQLSSLYAEVVNTLIARNSVVVRAVGCHGQTLRHFPHQNPPYTIQIVNGALLAQLTKTTTVVDFRSADLAAGGEGAPLAPGFHSALFHSSCEDRGVLNLGGIANITYIPKNQTQNILGFDTGPASALLDIWIAEHHNKSFDNDGTWAKTGCINTDLLDTFLSDFYFNSPPPKSTGRESFNKEWLHHKLVRFPDLKPEDIQATLVELTAKTISDSINSYLPTIQRLITSGGGSRNSYLIERIERLINPIELETSDIYKIGVNQVEAAAFAWLTYRRMNNLTGNIPTVTGATRECILGAIYEA
jgi:anhydro-N-acetylmuramic acid kinase